MINMLYMLAKGRRGEVALFIHKQGTVYGYTMTALLLCAVLEGWEKRMKSLINDTILLKGLLTEKSFLSPFSVCRGSRPTYAISQMGRGGERGREREKGREGKGD